MKNVLVIAPIRQRDGWGEAARDYVLAMSQIEGINLVVKPIYMSASIETEIPPEIVALEQKRCVNYDAVIQLVLPSLLTFDRNFGINIGFSFFEHWGLEYTGWIKRINMMDAYFVVSKVEKEALIESGVKIPIHVIGPTVNTAKFEQSYRPLPELDTDTFKFYFIGENTPRKNLDAALIAFHREFNRSDNVDFVIKTNNGLTQQQLELKSTLKLYANLNLYNREILVNGYLTNEEMARLHTSCNCFVMPSKGESICKPALDAMGFGNPCIVTDNTGMVEFVNNKNGYLVKSKKAPVVFSDRVIDDVYTSYEAWYEPDVYYLQKAMRKAYESNNDPNIKSPKPSRAMADVYQFSYQETARKIGEVLCG